MQILEDPTGELTYEQVSAQAYNNQFIPSTSEAPNYGFTKSAYWVRLPIRNTVQNVNNWLIEVGFSNMHYVDLYYPSSSEGEGFVHKQSGVMRPVREREIAYTHMVFYVPLDYGKDSLVYLRFQNGAPIILPLTLWSPDAFTNHHILESLILGIFYGALLIMLLYNLILIYNLRDWNYRYFVLFVGSLILYYAASDGLLESYVWPALNVYKKFTIAWPAYTLFIFALLFADSFLDVRRQMPQFRKIFTSLLFAMVIQIPLVYFFSYQTAGILIVISGTITLYVLLVNSFILSKRGSYQSRYYFFAWIIFFLSTITLLFVRIGIVNSSFITEQAMRVGSVWVVAFWAVALADRINLHKSETEAANRELNKNQRQLAQTLDGMPVAVMVYGQNHELTYINHRALEILNYPGGKNKPNLAVGATFEQTSNDLSLRVTGSDQEYPMDSLPVSKAYEGKSYSVDDIEADLGDRRVSLEVWANPVMDDDGQIESVVVGFQDISQRIKDDAELDDYRQNLEKLVADRTSQLDLINEQLIAENIVRRSLEKELELRLEWLVTVNQVYENVIRRTDLSQIYQKLTIPIKKLFEADFVFIAELDMDKTGEKPRVRDTAQQEFIILSQPAEVDFSPGSQGTIITIPACLLTRLSSAQGRHMILSRQEFHTLGGVLDTSVSTDENQSMLLSLLQFPSGFVGLVGFLFNQAERTFKASDFALLEKICIDIAQIDEKAWQYEQDQANIAAEERNRLARDLHDTVTQLLFAASLVAEVLPQIWRRDQKLGHSSLVELRRLTRAALAEMRTMLLELRPSAVVKTPLADLLAQLTEAVTSRSSLAYNLFIEQIPPLPEDVHICFYRVAQESLNNVIKHAHASHLEVHLSANPVDTDTQEKKRTEVKLVVRDDGRGLVAQEHGPSKMGLGIMRERAAAIHGKLSLESQAGKGTTVVLTWIAESRETI